MRHSSTTSRCQDDCTKATRCGLAKRGCCRAADDRRCSSGECFDFGDLATSDSWLSSFRTRIRAHGTTRRAQSAAAATVLFHPDFNRRLRNRTESADPSSKAKKALAGLGFVTLTAGGDFHPALRTSAARYERPEANYAEARLCQQAPFASEICMSAMTADAKLAASGRLGARKSTIRGAADAARTRIRARTRMPRIRFRFVPIVNSATAMSCGRARALPVDGLRGAVARIPQITSLDPRKLWRSAGDCSRQRRVGSARVGLLRAYQHIQKARSRRHVPPRRHHRFPEQSACGGRGHRRRSTTGRSNAPAKTRSPSSPRATGPTISCPSPG